MPFSLTSYAVYNAGRNWPMFLVLGVSVANGLGPRVHIRNGSAIARPARSQVVEYTLRSINGRLLPLEDSLLYRDGKSLARLERGTLIVFGTDSVRVAIYRT